MRAVRAPGFVANFDSAAAMLRALARFLHGKDFPGLGMSPLLRSLAPLVNRVPERARERVYAWSGFAEAVPAGRLGAVRAERISEWVVGEYPDRPYPAIAVGSSNGAAVHLCAALGIPWLPQTFLVPVRHPGIDRDDPEAALRWGRGPGRELLRANPALRLHHMHDANQDRLMISRMAYFRVKRLALGAAYEAFVRGTLVAGGTIIVVDCRRSWPVTRVGDRHIFQHGAVGGASADEYLYGGERVERFLAAEGSARRRWKPPEPDGEAPEAEWGFEPALLDDLLELARGSAFRLCRLVFEEPEDLSALVAELHRAWYRERGLAGDRLVVDSFILLDPWWTLRTGSVPYWATFGVEPSASALERYLDGVEPYAELYAMLFSHGVESIGLAGIERWRAVLERGHRRVGFLGVDTDAYPRDFGAFARYHTALKALPGRALFPGPLGLERLERFVSAEGDRFGVRLEPAS